MSGPNRSLEAEDFPSALSFARGEAFPSFDLDTLESLCRMARDYELAELEIEFGGARVKIGRTPSGAAVIPQAEAPIALSDQEPDTLIRSPIVGTFFRAASPDSEPFIEVGSLVQPGHILCIIEAMKLMNEIEAETPGRITAILVENGQMIDQGQPLFTLAKQETL